jgi:uncharacterized lipoprotein
MNRGASLSLALICCLAGCFENPGLICQDSERYANSIEVAPIQIPNDLNPPDESEALRIPRVTGQPRVLAEGACTESPPDFFSEGSSE